MKKSILLLTAILIVSASACGNTTPPAPSASKASTAPSSSVAEVKDDYVAIGGKTPYETLTATEEANIKKAEEEARLQAEAKARAKADAEAKAKAQAQAHAQQAQANQTAEAQNTEQTGGVQQAQPAQQAEQPAPEGYHWYTYPSGQTVLMVDSPYIALKELYENAPDEKSKQQAWGFLQEHLKNGAFGGYKTKD